MKGARIEAVELRRPDLRRPFPPDFCARLLGQTVVELSRRGKYLLATLSSGDVLLAHLGMSGWFYITAPDAPKDGGLRLEAHDHAIFRMSSGAVITFNDPRRFGMMDLLTPEERARHPVLSKLGPEPLSHEFDGVALARACQGRKTSLKAALLDQRVVAGLGNIYAAEALHCAGLAPHRRAGTIATPSGAPRESAHRLAAAVKRVVADAVARTVDPGRYRGARFRVYDREGKRCLRPRCGGIIRRRPQAGRSTFYCPVCQK